MGVALQKLSEEDPTFRAETNVETGETIIAGMGDLNECSIEYQPIFSFTLKSTISLLPHCQFVQLKVLRVH